ncbi:MAG: hypothetical protein ABFD64_02355 [Armatimonadota bacterium]
MRKWLVPLIISITATAVWWTHAALTDMNSPCGSRLDDAMWVFTSVAKYIVLLSIPFALNRVFRHCDGNKERSVKASIVWGLTGLMLLTVLSLLRSSMANFLNNDAIKFFPITEVGPKQSSQFLTPLLPDAIARRQNGSIFVTEAITIVLCAVVCGVIAYRSRLFGRIWPGITAAAVLAVVITIANFGFRLLVLDYDIFMAGTLLPSITLEFFSPIATDPATEISLLACLCLILSSFFMDLKWSRGKTVISS